MIDDLAAIAKCGSDSVELNAIVNAKIKSKFLEFGVGKCFNLHVGHKLSSCPKLLAQDDEIKEVSEVTYYYFRGWLK